MDDLEENRELLTRRLSRFGYSVQLAENGEDGIAKALSEQPAVILMDMSMPVMDGWEATRRLKADPRTSSIPIIALTGHALKSEADNARAAGCDSFISRPCPPAAVLAEVRRMLQAHPRDRGAGKPG